MAESVFPAFLRLQNDDDSGAKAAFLRQVDDTFTAAGARARRFGDETGRAMEGATKSTAAVRQASLQAGQQLTDFAVQVSSGQRVSTALAQQLPQLAFAFIGLEKSSNPAIAQLGAFGRFMSGPWGAAIGIGAMALGPLVGKLFETEDAAQKVQFATNAMSDAQSILGSVLDMTTGKLNTQSTALIALARAKLAVAQIDSANRAADARKALTDAAGPQWSMDAGFGGGLDIRRAKLPSAVTAERVLLGYQTPDQAIKDLEALRDAGKITDATFKSVASTVANLGVELANAKVYSEAEKLLNGTGGRELLKPAKASRASAGRATSTTTEDNLARRAADTIASTFDRFTNTPKLIEQTDAATRKLNETIADLEKRKPTGWADLVAKAHEALVVVAKAPTLELDRYVRDAERGMELATLTAAGREREAAALQAGWQAEERFGKLKADDLAHITATAEKQYDLNRALKQATEIQAGYLDATRSIRSEIEGVVAGTGKLGNIGQAVRQAQAKAAVGAVFGPAFDKLEGWIKGNTGLDPATQALLNANGRAATSVRSLADAFDKAAARISGAPAPGNSPAVGAANDNADIMVEGHSPYAAMRNLIARAGEMTSWGKETGTALSTPVTGTLDALIGGTFFTRLNGAISSGLGGLITMGPAGGLLGVLKELAPTNSRLADILGGKEGADGMIGAFRGMGVGQLTGSLVGLDRQGSAIGGAIGGAFKDKVFGKLGELIPGIGGIVGGLVGGLLGSVFSSAKTGSAAIGASKFGSATVTGTGGNNAAQTAAANSAGGAVSNQLNQIADQLHADFGQFGVAIGLRNDEYRVSASGNQKNTTDKHTGSDIIYQGKDANAAIAAAVQNAIQDGALKGISQASERILKSGQDMNVALQKAVAIENIPRQLKAITDPVGAAIDDLNFQFGKLKNYLDEGSATAAQYAQAEELYQKQRAAAVKQAMDQATGSIRGLYDSLTTGNETRSLSERMAAAQAKYDPLASRAAAGDATAFNDFADAAKTMLDIRRQLYGSQADYFSTENQVRALTKWTIDGQKALADAAQSASDSPFKNAGPANVVIDDKTRSALEAMGIKLDASNENLGAILAAIKGGYLGAPSVRFASNF
jgi:hypothetical protein